MTKIKVTGFRVIGTERKQFACCGPRGGAALVTTNDQFDETVFKETRQEVLEDVMKRRPKAVVSLIEKVSFE